METPLRNNGRPTRVSTIVQTREHVYLTMMVGTPLVAALALCRSPVMPPPVCEAPPAIAVQQVQPQAATTVTIVCDDGLSAARRPANPRQGESVALGQAVALDASWTRYVAAAVQGVTGEVAPLVTGATRLSDGRVFVVATSTDGEGRSISAFTINDADSDAGQVAHLVCGHRPTAVYAVSPGIVEVQFDDGWAVWATPDAILAPDSDGPTDSGVRGASRDQRPVSPV